MKETLLQKAGEAYLEVLGTFVKTGENVVNSPAFQRLIDRPLDELQRRVEESLGIEEPSDE